MVSVFVIGWLLVFVIMSSRFLGIVVLIVWKKLRFRYGFE